MADCRKTGIDVLLEISLWGFRRTKQRAAVARTLIRRPQLILTDEPTGALDSSDRRTVEAVWINEKGKDETILMVTHSTKAASHTNRILLSRTAKYFISCTEI